MKVLDTILNYLFFLGLGLIGGFILGVVQRPYALEKIFDYCIAK